MALRLGIDVLRDGTAAEMDLKWANDSPGRVVLEVRGPERKRALELSFDLADFDAALAYLRGATQASASPAPTLDLPGELDLGGMGEEEEFQPSGLTAVPPASDEAQETAARILAERRASRRA